MLTDRDLADLRLQLIDALGEDDLAKVALVSRVVGEVSCGGIYDPEALRQDIVTGLEPLQIHRIAAVIRRNSANEQWDRDNPAAVELAVPLLEVLGIPVSQTNP